MLPSKRRKISKANVHKKVRMPMIGDTAWFFHGKLEADLRMRSLKEN